jgi:hypothetical protein
MARVVVQQVPLDQVEIVHDFRERSRDVNFPVCGSIAYYKALKVKLCLSFLDLNELVVLVNLPSKVRCVNASIALT